MPQTLELSDQTVKRGTTRSGVARKALERAAKVIDLMRTAVPLGVSSCDEKTDGRLLGPEAVDPSLPEPPPGCPAPAPNPLPRQGSCPNPAERRGGGVLPNRIFEAWTGENAELGWGQSGFGLPAATSF